MRSALAIPVLAACGGMAIYSVGSRGQGSPSAFRVPDAEAREAAIGDTRFLEGRERRIYRADPEAFEPIDEPAGADWLANHQEPGQTFVEFLHARRNRPNEAHPGSHPALPPDPAELR